MRRAFALSLFLGLSVASLAHATPIVINPGGALAGNVAALAAFNRAATTLGSWFSDPIEVNIAADLAVIANPNVIGSTSSVLLGAGYTTVRNAVVADAANEPDDAIVAALPTAAQFSATVPGAGWTLSGQIATTKANFKALGFTGLDAAFGATDATITFNSTFAFDYDSSDGVGAGLVDFETVALHELVHSLGFISGVDLIDGLAPRAITFTALDLFRFSTLNTPTTTAQFTTNARSLVPGAAANISDVANAWGMSTGVVGGDGRQASHWKDDALTGVLIGIMDPTLSSGVSRTLTFADIRALDLIGWDPVPEPASLLLLGSGLIAVYVVRRRQGQHVRH